MLKILFAGPVGAGKTSAIEAVSDTEVVQTEALASDETAQRKARTTVAMDYGTLRVDDELTIQLIGAPGQQRFDFMWEILGRGAIGLVILIDHCRPDPLADLGLALQSFSDTLQKHGAACAVGITRMDLSNEVSLEPYLDFIESSGHAMPVFEIDARKPKDVRTLLLALVAMLDPRGQKRQRRDGG